MLRPNFAAVYNTLDRDTEYTLHTRNALGVQEGYPLRQSYINHIQEYCGGRATNVDFARPEQHRQIINGSVAEQTNHITQLLPSGSITPAIRVVLTNAVYFNGEWEIAFDKSQTRKENSHTPNVRWRRR